MIFDNASCELWPAPEPRELAVFGPGDDGALVLLETGRVRDPRELGTRPRVAHRSISPPPAIDPKEAPSRNATPA